VLGGLLVQVVDLLPQGALLAGRTTGTLFVFDGDVEALPECLDGFGEAELLGLTDEADGVAGFAAAEALEEALVGIDVEGRGLFVVERTKPLEPGAAGLAEGDDPGNHIGEVDPQLEVADAGGFDGGHGGETEKRVIPLYL